jgi:hypothetical protein
MASSCAVAIAAGVCPVLIGFIGAGSNGEKDYFCGLWPIPLLLAPCTEACSNSDGNEWSVFCVKQG